MAHIPVVAVAAAAFVGVWLLLGLTCGPGAMHGAARERIRLRLLGWAQRLSSSRVSLRLARIPSLAELGAALSGVLSRAGFDVEPQVGCVFVCMVSLAAVLVCGIVAQSALGLLFGAFGAAGAIMLWGSALARARKQALAREMPRVFRSLAGSLAAGRTLPQALASLGKSKDLTSKAYGRAALAMVCGYSAKDALTQLSRELDANGSELLVSALLVSHRTGSPLMGLFQRAALIAERENDLARLLSVKTAQVRLSVRVVCVLPAVLVGILVLISPDFREGLLSPAGRLSLAIATALDLLAVFIVRRLLADVIP